MIQHLSHSEALQWFAALPAERRIATLSPDYVMADALRDAELVPCFFGYREENALWLHGVHRSPIPGMPGMCDHQSPYGYGGPVSNVDTPDFLARAWSAYVETCRAEQILAEFVRLHPMAGTRFYGGIIREDRDTVTMDVQQQDLRATYSPRCRTAIRKAQNEGISIKQAERGMIARQFGNFYRAGMQAIGATDFFQFDDHYFEAFDAWTDAELLVCERDGEWLSAGLFLTDARVMEYHLSATTLPGRNCGATNLLLDAAAHHARDRGCHHLYLGGGTDGHTDNPLLFFKQSFSPLRRPFFIGFTAFFQDHYDALRAEFVRQGRPVNRFLFYRQ